MNAATMRLEGHDAYLHALNRALRVGLVLSFIVHAALVGMLPSPFHHDHPRTEALRVELVEVPPPAERAKRAEAGPLVEQPKPVPIARPPPSKPEPIRSHKSIAEPKPAREQPVAPLTPAGPETDRLSTHVQPERAVTSMPVSPSGGDVKEKPETAPSTPFKDAGADAGPETPPSFRAGYLRNPEPPYPTASRRLGEQGTVQLRVLVTADGHAARVDVHRSSGSPRLDEAASAAVRAWRFVPAKRGATPVEAVVIVPIVFRLEVE